MRLVAACAVVSSLAWSVACEPTSSPISRIPSPTAPTPPSATNFYTPPTIVAQPTFRRTIAGTVREVDGGPLPGVEIEVWPDTGAGEKVAETAADGTFRIETAFDAIELHKYGYQSRWWRVPYDSRAQPTHTVAVKLQPRVLVAAGTRLSSVVTPDDLTYPDDGSFPWDSNFVCAPCKLIEVSGADNGATLKLAWSGSMQLSLWAGSAGYWGHDVHASARTGESEIVVASEFAVTVILVGVNASTLRYPMLTEPVAFTLAVEKRN